MSDLLSQFEDCEPTINNLLEWQKALVAERLLKAVQERLRRTAVLQLWGARGQDAHDELAWLDAHLKELGQRLVAEGTKEATVATYRSRAGHALRDFLRFRSNPAEFRQKVETTEEHVARSRSRELRTFELRPGRVFRYELPPGGLTVPEVGRIYLHLLALVPNVTERQTGHAIQQVLFSDSDGDDD